MKCSTPFAKLCLVAVGLAALALSCSLRSGRTPIAADRASLSALPSAARLHSLKTRVPWTSSRLVGSPEPPSPYRTEPVFPRLKFVEPLELVAIPGSDRFVLAEHAHNIFSIPNDPACSHPDLFADMKQLDPEILEVYSVAFHPQFTNNHFVYIWYILKPELPDGTHISRFKVTDSIPPQVDFKTEQVVFTWKSGGHNGGCMRFGLDGYLYISTGDGAGPDPPDPLNTGQDISDVLSSILRIDVDRGENDKAYRIPPDNPFINTPGARPEVWAYGLRNPWRMSIDRKTGDLWVGDVGWELWEMIYRVERGGNYGWSLLEGSHQPVKPEGKHGPTPILPPILEHPHSEAASITGGYVYRGKRFPELIGSYIYGDWETRKIWELRYDGSRVTRARELVTTPYRIVSFGEDNDGELYIVDFGGTIQRLAPNPAAGTSSTFPHKLSETGLFASVAKQEPSPGVLPYSVNAELWTDYATAERFVAFPGASGITTNEGRWQFPTNAVLAKTLSLEMERGKPASRRKLETQLLHFTGEGWNAYSYQWNAEQTDATLVPASGAEQELTVIDAAAPGHKRRQTWRFHSRAECLRCHNPWCNTALAFEPLQLNKSAHYAIEGSSRQTNANQLRVFADLGLIAPGIVASNLPPALVNPHDPTSDLNARARSYLHVNCSHCHREHAGGSVLSYMNFDLPLEKAALVGKSPSQGSLGMQEAEVVAAGDPCRSVLYYRISKLGKGHMPYLGSSLLDESGVSLIHDWIQQLPSSTTNLDSQAVAKRQADEAAALNKLRSTSPVSVAEQTRAIEPMLLSVSHALSLLRAVDEKSLPPALCKTIVAKGTASPEPLVRDLFERFLPDEKRVKLLGNNIKPEVIFARKGDAARGRKLFTREGGAQCQTCHRAEGVGRDFGPDLSHIGQKYTRGQILENILEPSKSVDPKFVAYVIETKDEAIHSGFLLGKTGDQVVLKEASAGQVRFLASDIKSMEAQRLSLMPEGLLQGMTAQEAADLVEYLQSLR